MNHFYSTVVRKSQYRIVDRIAEEAEEEEEENS
jgi:hypothetical protein